MGYWNIGYPDQFTIVTHYLVWLGYAIYICAKIKCKDFQPLYF